jgi:hypothetical protein
MSETDYDTDMSFNEGNAYEEATTPYIDNIAAVVGNDNNEYYDENGSDFDPNEPIGDVDLEIVGLLANNNGRSCSIHGCCGSELVVGDVLRLKETIVTVEGRDEYAVKLVRIDDGVEGCTVAFVPRLQLDLPIVQRNIGHFAVVKELYQHSKYSFLRSKSHRNLGMAGVVLLNEIATMP